MFTLIVENKYGEQLEITHNSAYSISSIDGFDPPDAIINTNRNAGQDGSTFNSSYVGERSITITMAINYPAEINRIQLYRYFKTKQWVKLYYKNGSRNVWTDGYVQSMPVAYFDKKETIQITVKCPRPYLMINGSSAQEFSNIIPRFEFPFSIEEAGIPFSEIEITDEAIIYNAGDVETGFVISAKMLGVVENTKIFNSNTREQFSLNYTFMTGDVLTINTVKGQKEVNVLRNGEEINLIGALVYGSTWLQLQPGDNEFMLAADSGMEYLQLSFKVTALYEGV